LWLRPPMPPARPATIPPGNVSPWASTRGK
jgi:hypothetical protein